MIAFGIDAIDAVRSSPHPTALNASYRVDHVSNIAIGSQERQ
jgi:hypothetical protein